MEREVGLRKDELDIEEMMVLLVRMIKNGRNKLFLLLENLAIQKIHLFTPAHLIILLYSLHHRNLLTLEMYQLIEHYLLSHSLDSLSIQH
jgi:hypothetical protein